MSSRAVPIAPPLEGARRFRDFGVPALALAVLLVALAIALATSRIVIADPSRHPYVPVAGPAGWLPWLMLAGLALFGSVALALFVRSRADRMRLLALSRLMGDTAGTDWLTGLYNRRALSDHLARASAYARRHGDPVSVLMIALDGLRETNERYGREAGDAVLRAVSQCMRAELRGDDVCGRWDGDEFLIIMPAIDELAAKIAAERLRDAAAGLELAEAEGRTGVELSIGTASGSRFRRGRMTGIAPIRTAIIARSARRAQSCSRLEGVLAAR